MIPSDLELLGRLQQATVRIQRFVADSLGADPVSIRAQCELAVLLMRLGHDLSERACNGEPINGYVNGVMERDDDCP